MSYDRDYYEELRPSAGLAKRVDDARDRFIVRHLRREVSAGSVLDVGCGRGDLLTLMADDFGLHGIELSPDGLQQAVVRVPDARLVAADIEQGPPFAGPFDAVTAINVLEHLSKPEAGLASIAAMQEPGGVLVVHLPVIGNRSQARLYEGGYASDPTHVWRPSGPEARAAIESAGYRHLRSAYAPFRPGWVMARLPIHPAWFGVFTRVAP